MVPFSFMSVHAGKNRTEEKSKTDIKKIKTTWKKANNTKNSKTKLAWYSRFLQHSARNKVGLFYNDPKPKRGI